MSIHTRPIATAIMAGMTLVSSSAWATSLPYPGAVVVQDGAYDNIVETSITDTPPLYGAPSAGAGNELVFPMPGFSASAANSSSDITSGALELTFDADPGKRIDTISLSEAGSYNIVGDAGVTAAGTMTVRYFDELTQQLETIAAPILMMTDPVGGFPVEGAGAGTWQGSSLIDLGALGIDTTHVILALDNSLIASAGPDASAQISKDAFAINVTTIPEPASLALMGLGAMLIAKKRSR